MLRVRLDSKGICGAGVSAAAQVTIPSTLSAVGWSAGLCRGLSSVVPRSPGGVS